jgi:hypothetical protein
MREAEFYESLTDALNKGYRFAFNKGDFGNQTDVFMVSIVAEPNLPLVCGVGETLIAAYLDCWNEAIARPTL